jgi:hypothetical protein
MQSCPAARIACASWRPRPVEQPVIKKSMVETERVGVNAFCAVYMEVDWERMKDLPDTCRTYLYIITYHARAPQTRFAPFVVLILSDEYLSSNDAV